MDDERHIRERKHKQALDSTSKTNQIYIAVMQMFFKSLVSTEMNFLLQLVPLVVVNKKLK